MPTAPATSTGIAGELRWLRSATGERLSLPITLKTYRPNIEEALSASPPEYGALHTPTHALHFSVLATAMFYDISPSLFMPSTRFRPEEHDRRIVIAISLIIPYLISYAAKSSTPPVLSPRKSPSPLRARPPPLAGRAGHHLLLMSAQHHTNICRPHSGFAWSSHRLVRKIENALTARTKRMKLLAPLRLMPPFGDDHRGQRLDTSAILNKIHMLLRCFCRNEHFTNFFYLLLD